MKVEIHHTKGDGAGFEHVATITVPDSYCKRMLATPTLDYKESYEPALDYAWRWSNNIGGSWSKGELLGSHVDRLTTNSDYNPNTEVVKPLRYDNGNCYGHRSSMMGDTFIVVADDGTKKRFEAQSFGFKEVAP